jgi:hypothetical protein
MIQGEDDKLLQATGMTGAKNGTTDCTLQVAKSKAFFFKHMGRGLLCSECPSSDTSTQMTSDRKTIKRGFKLPSLDHQKRPWLNAVFFILYSWRSLWLSEHLFKFITYNFSLEMPTERRFELLSLPGWTRAETLKMLFYLADQPFFDHRITINEWKAHKAKSNFNLIV